MKISKFILQNPLISDHSFVIAWVGDRNVQSDAKTFYQILILKILDLKRKTPIDVELLNTAATQVRDVLSLLSNI